MTRRLPIGEGEVLVPERGELRQRLEAVRLAKEFLKTKLRDENLEQAVDQAFVRVEAALDNPQVANDVLVMLLGRLDNIGASKARIGFPAEALKFYTETWLRLVDDNLA